MSNNAAIENYLFDTCKHAVLCDFPASCLALLTPSQLDLTKAIFKRLTLDDRLHSIGNNSWFGRTICRISRRLFLYFWATDAVNIARKALSDYRGERWRICSLTKDAILASAEQCKLPDGQSIPFPWMSQSEIIGSLDQYLRSTRLFSVDAKMPNIHVRLAGYYLVDRIIKTWLENGFPSNVERKNILQEDILRSACLGLDHFFSVVYKNPGLLQLSDSIEVEDTHVVDGRMAFAINMTKGFSIDAAKETLNLFNITSLEVDLTDKSSEEKERFYALLLEKHQLTKIKIKSIPCKAENTFFQSLYKWRDLKILDLTETLINHEHASILASEQCPAALTDLRLDLSKVQNLPDKTYWGLRLLQADFIQEFKETFELFSAEKLKEKGLSFHRHRVLNQKIHVKEDQVSAWCHFVTPEILKKSPFALKLYQKWSQVFDINAKTVHVHSFVGCYDLDQKLLVSHSCILERMIDDPILEGFLDLGSLAATFGAGVVDPLAFHLFQDFIRGGQGKWEDLTLQEIYNLYDFADRFLVVELIHDCREALRNIMNENRDPTTLFEFIRWIESNKFPDKILRAFVKKTEFMLNIKNILVKAKVLSSNRLQIFTQLCFAGLFNDLDYVEKVDIVYEAAK